MPPTPTLRGKTYPKLNELPKKVLKDILHLLFSLLRHLKKYYIEEKKLPEAQQTKAIRDVSKKNGKMWKL